MRTGANILWFLLGGWLLGPLWYLSAVVMTVSIIGIPWSRACWEMGTMSLMPFGREVVSHTELTGQSAGAMGILRLIANLIWLPFGFVLSLAHVVHGCIMFCTIIGIPLALQDFKLAGISLFPVGKRVVSKELAEVARNTNAQAQLARFRQ
jgi:uncharacterized membrane protein YccF (DUF307 family)